VGVESDPDSMETEGLLLTPLFFFLYFGKFAFCVRLILFIFRAFFSISFCCSRCRFVVVDVVGYFSFLVGFYVGVLYVADLFVLKGANRC
jgi:hypothetical protein